MKNINIKTTSFVLTMSVFACDSMAMEMDVEKNTQVGYQENRAVTRAMSKTTASISTTLEQTARPISVPKERTKINSTPNQRLNSSLYKNSMPRIASAEVHKPILTTTTSPWGAHSVGIYPAYNYHTQYYVPMYTTPSYYQLHRDSCVLKQHYAQCGLSTMAPYSAQFNEVKREEAPSLFSPSMEAIVIEEPKKTVVEEIVIENPQKTVVEEIVIEEPKNPAVAEIIIEESKPLVQNPGPNEIVLKDVLEGIDEWKRICARNIQEEKSSFANNAFLELAREYRDSIKKVDLRNTDVTWVIFAHIQYLTNLESLDTRNAAFLHLDNQKKFDKKYIEFFKHKISTNPTNSEVVNQIIVDSYFI